MWSRSDWGISNQLCAASPNLLSELGLCLLTGPNGTRGIYLN